MDILNPSTGKIIQSVAEDDGLSVKNKFEIIKEGHLTWKKTGLDQRIGIIQRFSDLLAKNKDRLAKILTSEMGKPINESLGEIAGARGRIHYFINHSVEWLSPREEHDDGTTKDTLVFESLGVIANISAWNYPYLVGVNVFIPALIGGNVVLYKPSEFSTLTGQEITKLLYLAGVPENAFQLIAGNGKIGQELLKLDLQGLFFTGSYATGIKILESTKNKLYPVGMELGGKDPLYVTDQIADIESVASSVVEGVFYNNGQSCCSVERVYVHEKIYDQFLNLFVKKVAKLKVGDPLDLNTSQGPLTRKEHLIFLKDQVEEAISKGAKLETGGEFLDSPGYYFLPTVLSSVNHNMRVMKEESFGPIIGIQKVKDDQEALELMDDTEYGLTASVFCSDQLRAKKILSELEVGSAYINCCDRVSPYLPWSGARHSGLGQTLGFQGILAFVRPKGFHVR